MTSTEGCRYCGEPLPPRDPRRRGRPRVTHEGDCQRLYRNYQKFEQRKRKFRAAFSIDGADAYGRGWAATEYDQDEIRDEGGRLSGYQLVPNPAALLQGAVLARVMEEWEKAERQRRELYRIERARLNALPSILDGLSEEEQRDLVAKAVARRLARRNFE